MIFKHVCALFLVVAFARADESAKSNTLENKNEQNEVDFIQNLLDEPQLSGPMSDLPQESGEESDDEDFDKRSMPGVMRFGKREMPGVMRFGKKAMPGVMRFGKRNMPGVMRFGKKSMPGVMRFGKRAMPGVMRFGKRDDEDTKRQGPAPIRFG